MERRPIVVNLVKLYKFFGFAEIGEFSRDDRWVNFPTEDAELEIRMDFGITEDTPAEIQ